MPFNILIVDDNLSIRNILRAYLESNPEWKVCEAENGQVAVQRVKELSPDVVILDWQMPIMNGLEAARQITQIAPGIAMVVMFTMHCYQSLSQEAKAAGIRQVFSKSDGPAHLIASLESLYSGRQTGLHLGQVS